MTEGIFRHKNGLKHINIVDSDGFSALFVVNTPIFDNSGVAHGVEHMVFRRSTAFPKPETLFQLTSLTDAKINASTFAETTYFHCQSQCEHTFLLAINYLLNGLFDPIFKADDLLCEIHDGGAKGVIYRELLGSEHASENNVKTEQQSEFDYGGLSASIGELSLNDLRNFHQRFYQASNITLVTANADIEQISHFISLLPKPQNQPIHCKKALDKHQKNTKYSKENEPHQKKYSQVINKLISLYHSWLQDPYHQEIEDYNEIKITKKPLITHTDTFSKLATNNLISPLLILSNVLLKEINKDKATYQETRSIGVKHPSNKTILPNLFTKLYQQAKNQLLNNMLRTKESNIHSNNAWSNDQRNALWLTDIAVSNQKVANIASYIISAYPLFLAPRCQGMCYATQASTIENSAYLAIYSAFDINPETRLTEIQLCLLKLSQDKSFIINSLALAKIKYYKAYQADNGQVNTITSSDISSYLRTIASGPHPKV